MAMALSTAALVLDLSSRLILDCAVTRPRRVDTRLPLAATKRPALPGHGLAVVDPGGGSDFRNGSRADPFLDLIASYTHDSLEPFTAALHEGPPTSSAVGGEDTDNGFVAWEAEDGASLTQISLHFESAAEGTTGHDDGGGVSIEERSDMDASAEGVGHEYLWHRPLQRRRWSQRHPRRSGRRKRRRRRRRKHRRQNHVQNYYRHTPTYPPPAEEQQQEKEDSRRRRRGRRRRPRRHRRRLPPASAFLPAFLSVGSLVGFGLGALSAGDTSSITFNPTITQNGDNITLSVNDSNTVTNDVSSTSTNSVTNSLTNTNTNNVSTTVIPITVSGDGKFSLPSVVKKHPTPPSKEKGNSEHSCHFQVRLRSGPSRTTGGDSQTVTSCASAPGVATGPDWPSSCWPSWPRRPASYQKFFSKKTLPSFPTTSEMMNRRASKIKENCIADGRKVDIGTNTMQNINLFGHVWSYLGRCT